MKSILLIIILLSSLSGFGQSQEDRLKEYKDLYDKGLIDSVEYRTLKKALLEKQLSSVSEPDSAAKFSYQLAKDKVRTGNVLMGIGVAGGIGTVIYWKKAVPVYTPPQGGSIEWQLGQVQVYNQKVKSYKNTRVVFAGLSGIFFIAGAAMAINGSISREIYENKYHSLNIGPNGLTLNF